MRLTWRSALIGLFSLSSLGLIIFILIEAFRLECLPEEGYSIFDGQTCTLLPWDLSAVFVAFGFWLAGIYTGIRKQREPSSVFFFLCAGVLVTGLYSGMERGWSVGLFYALLAWACPLVYHFYFSLLDRQFKRYERYILLIFYLFASLFSFPFIFLPIPILQSVGLLSILMVVIRLAVFFTAILTTCLLVIDYRAENSRIIQRRIRLMTSGTVISIFPLFFLSVFPHILGNVLLPTAINLPWLLLIPASFLLAIARRKNIKLELILMQIAVYYLQITLLLSLFLIVSGMFHQYELHLSRNWNFIITLLVSFLLALYMPLRKKIGQVIDWVFYGDDNELFDSIARINKSLNLVQDRGKLVNLLVDELYVATHSECIALFIQTKSCQLTLAGAIGWGAEAWEVLSGFQREVLRGYFCANNEIVDTETLKKFLSKGAHSVSEIASLVHSDIVLCVPLISGNAQVGLILLGERLSGENYSGKDRQILSILAGQAGAAVHNVLLIEELQFRQAELVKTHRQFLFSQEKQRLSIARELHDGAVQQLIAVNIQIENAQKTLQTSEHLTPIGEAVQILDESRGCIRETSSLLRRTIRELRPPALEELGLAVALEGYIARLSREHSNGKPKLECLLDYRDPNLLDEVAVCLFRVAQEALLNALRHAQANLITLSFKVLDDAVFLQITDDGIGFNVPENLNQFVENNHFGLAGIHERVMWAGGFFIIHSEPGCGTDVTVKVPRIVNPGEEKQ